MRKQGKRDQECDGEILGLGMQGLGQRKPGHDRRPHRFPIQRDCRLGRVANPRDSERVSPGPVQKDDYNEVLGSRAEA